MTTAVIEKKKYTYADYIKTPDDKQYELIEGDLLMTPSPAPNHQRISRKLGFVLEEFVTQNSLGEIFYAPCDVYLDEENVVQPDILFISQSRLAIIGEKNIQGAPDLAIEIVSESSAYRDMVRKKRLYAGFGVKEYWIVIPDGKVIEIYTLKGNAYQLHKSYNEEDILKSPALKGLNIALQRML